MLHTPLIRVLRNLVSYANVRILAGAQSERTSGYHHIPILSSIVY